MPQLNQLSDVFLSQLLWLALVLGFIYFVIARGMVPKIQATVEQRDQRIADDLAAAERAKAEADATEEAYRAKMDESRAEAMKLTGAARQEGALRNPAAADGQQGRLFIGFAAAELLGLMAFAVAMIILYAI
jgi:F-type H+-transporting ATPase subunit b